VSVNVAPLDSEVPSGLALSVLQLPNPPLPISPPWVLSTVKSAPRSAAVSSAALSWS
jgi:hypothetical protein